MMVTLNIFFLDGHFFGFSGSSGPSQLTRTISAPSTSSFPSPSLRVGMAPFPIRGGFCSGPGVPRVELVGSSSVPFSNLSKLSESSIFSSFPISGSVDGEKMWSFTSIHKGECGPTCLWGQLGYSEPALGELLASLFLPISNPRQFLPVTGINKPLRRGVR